MFLGAESEKSSVENCGIKPEKSMSLQALFLCLLPGWLPCFSSQEGPGPDSILKKAIEAHGGAKNMKKPRMGILRGASKDDDTETTQEETFDLPKRWKRVTTLTVEAKKRTAFLLQIDGKQWEWEEGAEVRQTKNETKASPYFGLLATLAELTDAKVTLSALPPPTIKGQSAVGFAAKWEAGSGDYYFDKGTGLLAQAAFRWQPEPGKEFEAKSLFGDYKVIDGVKLPYRRTFFLKGGDLADFVQVADFFVNDVKILDRISNDVFAIPGKNQVSPPPQTDDKPTHRKIKYIDIHTHVGRYYWGKELTLDGLIKLMDKNGIERACVLPLISPEAGLFPQTVEDALAAYKKYPDRIIPFCVIDPRSNSGNSKRFGRIDLESMVALLKRYKDLGCKGFGEHQVGLPFDHPLMMTVYEACEKVDLPILFHLDDIRGIDSPGLPRLENVLKTYPKLRLIGHAAGFWASISGDATMADFGRYPKIPTPITPGGALDRLLAKYPNLYCDLSEPGGHLAIARDKKFGREFILRHADRCLFGTDYLMADHQVPQFDLLDSLDLPELVQYKVYRGNAIKVLKLEGVK